MTRQDIEVTLAVVFAIAVAAGFIIAAAMFGFR